MKQVIHLFTLLISLVTIQTPGHAAERATSATPTKEQTLLKLSGSLDKPSYDTVCQQISGTVFTDGDVVRTIADNLYKHCQRTRRAAPSFSVFYVDSEKEKRIEPCTHYGRSNQRRLCFRLKSSDIKVPPTTVIRGKRGPKPSANRPSKTLRLMCPTDEDTQAPIQSLVDAETQTDINPTVELSADTIEDMLKILSRTEHDEASDSASVEISSVDRQQVADSEEAIVLPYTLPTN